MTEEQAKKLRAAFKPAQIGKLPKPTKRENPKGKCAECGGWHGLPAVHLDYVGHAAITDRLLEVDPEWTWEPMARDPHGFPLLDQRGGLWILLTVCGVTRPGYGDETNGRGMKEAIGDALRNGAMRFGVGLDLWSKEDLHADEDSSSGGETTQTSSSARTSAPPETPSQFKAPTGDATPEQIAKIKLICVDIAEIDPTIGTAEDLFGKLGPILTKAKAIELVGKLERRRENAKKQKAA